MLLPRFIRSRLKQREMINFYKQFIAEGDLCFDIGANIGERTNYFLQLGASVVAVEPQSSCMITLEEKFSLNTKVKLIQKAVGATKGNAELFLCDETHECSTLSPDFVSVFSKVSGFRWNKKVEVEVTTLDELCAAFGTPKLCKIDVEGFESQVFLGLKKPIPYICFEFNQPFIKDTIKSLQILGSLGLAKCNFIKYEHMNLVLKDWISLQEFINHFDQFITDDILTGEIIVDFSDI
jgi:FkbM family methyltransferase